MSEHLCQVCCRPASAHEGDRAPLLPLCCFGCPCGSAQPDPARYHGVPGHCFSIDGDLWHDPGECHSNGKHLTLDNDRPCCGYSR
jgi:hypothetical protein